MVYITKTIPQKEKECFFNFLLHLTQAKSMTFNLVIWLTIKRDLKAKYIIIF